MLENLNQSKIGKCYLAPEGYAHELERELVHKSIPIVARKERLFCVAEGPEHLVWAEDVWLEPEFIAVESIGQASAALRSRQRNWALYSVAEHRRASLIREQLSKRSRKPFVFGSALPVAPMGAWTLLSRNLILASTRCSSPFPLGKIIFAEDKIGPPNRAYLKLWEVFTRLQCTPQSAELCLDLGSSPGGWSWVLAELGARVFSIDKAPLSPDMMTHPLIEHCIGSAFALDPAMIGNVNWLFSDIACYPDKLLSFVRKFIQNPNLNMICTVKLTQGADMEILDSFTSIPGSLLIHLSVNKHEVTWIRLALGQSNGLVW